MKRGRTVGWVLAVAVVAMSLRALAQDSPESAVSAERAYFPDILTIQRANYERLEKLYAAALNSENEGVVESALAHVAMFKLMYPVRELSILHRAVERIMKSHASPAIRHQAYLVDVVYESPAMFAQAARTTYESPDELFDELAAQVHESIVSTSQ